VGAGAFGADELNKKCTPIHAASEIENESENFRRQELCLRAEAGAVTFAAALRVLGWAAGAGCGGACLK
jgi:hypothetical protein